MARPVATHLPLALQSPPDDTEDEEMDITAEMLCASADRWRVTLRELELPTLLWVALLSLMLLAFVGEITWSVTSLMWAIVMWKQGCRTLNLCATVGASAMGLAILGSILIVSGPSPAGKSATPYLELGCCAHGAGDGSFALRGVGDACMPGGTELGVPLPSSDLDPLRPYHLVLLLPAGSVAQLEVAVSDAQGTELLPAVTLELGADDAFPWRPPANRTAAAAAATEVAGFFA